MTSFDGRIASPARRLCRMNFKRRLLPLFLALGFVTLIYGVKLLISLAGIKLIINLTDSAPHGVYAVVPLNELKKGTFIVFPVPFSVRHELGVRPWLRDDVPLIKPVAALSGEKVCVSDAEVIVAGQKRGPGHTAKPDILTGGSGSGVYYYRSSGAGYGGFGGQ